MSVRARHSNSAGAFGAIVTLDVDNALFAADCASRICARFS